MSGPGSPSDNIQIKNGTDSEHQSSESGGTEAQADLQPSSATGGASQDQFQAQTSTATLPSFQPQPGLERELGLESLSVSDSFRHHAATFEVDTTSLIGFVTDNNLTPHSREERCRETQARLNGGQMVLAPIRDEMGAQKISSSVDQHLSLESCLPSWTGEGEITVDTDGSSDAYAIVSEGGQRTEQQSSGSVPDFITTSTAVDSFRNGEVASVYRDTSMASLFISKISPAVQTYVEERLDLEDLHRVPSLNRLNLLGGSTNATHPSTGNALTALRKGMQPFFSGASNGKVGANRYTNAGDPVKPVLTAEEVQDRVGSQAGQGYLGTRYKLRKVA